MGVINRFADKFWPTPEKPRDPAALVASARERQRAVLNDLQGDLDEAEDELAYVEVEIARSQQRVTRLYSEVAAASAAGSTDLAGELHRELRQTSSFLAELTGVRKEVVGERARLTDLLAHLRDRRAEDDKRAAMSGDGAVAEAAPTPEEPRLTGQEAVPAPEF